MSSLRLIDGGAAGAAQQRTPFEGPSDEEALDAYSRTVAGVAERLAPAVASLRVDRRTRRGRVAAGAGSGVALSPTATCSPLPTSSPARAPGSASFSDGRELPLRGRRLATRCPTWRSSAPTPAGSSRPSSATPTSCASASSWSRSATRTGSAARSPPGVVSGARPGAAGGQPQRRPHHRQRDPDRRRAQPRQLRRRARRRRRARGRRQHRGRRRRARPRGAGQRGDAAGSSPR